MTEVLATAHRLYDALQAHDAARIVAALADDFVGEVSAGMPLGVGGRHDGPNTMLRDVWARIFSAYDVRIDVERYLVSRDDVVVALGHYRGFERATGRPVDARFAHVLSIRRDRVAGLEQITDTRSWTPGAADEPRPAAIDRSAA